MELGNVSKKANMGIIITSIISGTLVYYLINFMNCHSSWSEFQISVMKGSEDDTLTLHKLD